MWLLMASPGNLIENSGFQMTYIFYAHIKLTGPMRDVKVILQVYLSNSFYELMFWALTVKLDLSESHRIPLMINQLKFR